MLAHGLSATLWGTPGLQGGELKAHGLAESFGKTVDPRTVLPGSSHTGKKRSTAQSASESFDIPLDGRDFPAAALACEVGDELKVIHVEAEAASAFDVSDADWAPALQVLKHSVKLRGF